MRRSRAILALLTLLVVALGCGKRREDPILRLSANEALEMGKAFLADEKYYKAEQHLTHAFEVEPNSRSGREALLLAADALFLRGGSDNFIRCEAKYRDFLNRFPTSDRSDYAQYQVANCLASRVEKPDRDQQVTRKALEAFEELLRLYPTSSYIDDTHQRIRDVTDLLAAHELTIGDFYLSYGKGALCTAAVQRLEYLQREFPDFSQMDAALVSLSKAYGMCNRFDDADAALEELRREFPDSSLLGEAQKVQNELARKRTKNG